MISVEAGAVVNTHRSVHFHLSYSHYTVHWSKSVKKPLFALVYYINAEQVKLLYAFLRIPVFDESDYETLPCRVHSIVIVNNQSKSIAIRLLRTSREKFLKTCLRQSDAIPDSGKNFLSGLHGGFQVITRCIYGSRQHVDNHGVYNVVLH